MYDKTFLALGVAAAIMTGGCTGKDRAAGGTASEVLSGEVAGTITVSCYDSLTYKNFLDAAAKAFEEAYPGTTVTIETFSEMPEIKTSEDGNNKIVVVQARNDPQSRSDYINRVHTSLMSGGGADIFAADILPFHTYVENGRLENLDAYIAGDSAFNAADFRRNILNASRYNGGLYVMPIDYSFTYFAYDSTLLQGEITAGFGTGSAFTSGDLIENIEHLVENGKGVSLFDGSVPMFNLYDFSPDGMVQLMWNERCMSFLDLEHKRADFTGGAFAAMLTALRDYGDKGYIPRAVSARAGTARQDAAALMREAAGQQTDRYVFKANHAFSLVSQFSRNAGRRMLARGSTGIVDDDEIAGIAAREDGAVPFTFGQAYGINANSANKRTAWEFLKFLLREDMQTATAVSTLPLNNAARAKKAELVFSGAGIGGRVPLDEKQRAALDAYREAVERLSDQITAYTFHDTIIDDMVHAEIAYFANGSRSAEEVAGVLQNKAGLYLNE
ncbi:MAG: extracellular solute-binding protein [Treponema sp.]|jgi:multiple sugar transport system substrate-binding protein|nr:extracellular solute-binding protein [Treponema sp.]